MSLLKARHVFAVATLAPLMGLVATAAATSGCRVSISSTSWRRWSAAAAATVI